MQTLLQYAPKGLVDNIRIKQLMVLCRQESNPFLKQYQSKSIMPLGVTSHNVLINTFRQRQTYPNYGNVIYKFIFNENAWISIKISLKFVPKGPIKIFLHLVQIAWCQPGDKPLSEPMVFSLLTHICVAQPQWVNSMECKFIIWNHCLLKTFPANYFVENNIARTTLDRHSPRCVPRTPRSENTSDRVLRTSADTTITWSSGFIRNTDPRW